MLNKLLKLQQDIYNYHNTDEYMSLECGCVRTHSIDTVLTTNHIIEKIQLSKPIINTTYVENIKIFIAK